MSDPSSMSRESKKNQLRSRMITNSMPPKTSQEDSEEIVKQARRRVRRRHVFMFLFILILITIGSITDRKSVV